MAHKVDGLTLPFVAASAIANWVPVMFLPAASALSETVQRAGSHNNEVLGMTIATVASFGDPVAVQVAGVAKGVAGASMGAGARVAVGSTNGILVPLTPSNIASAADGSGLRFTAGKALKNAVAGDIFPVLIDPQQLI